MYKICLNENKRKVLLMYWDIPQHLKKKKINFSIKCGRQITSKFNLNCGQKSSNEMILVGGQQFKSLQERKPEKIQALTRFQPVPSKY